MAQAVALAAVLAASGVLAGTASAAGKQGSGQQTVWVPLAYTCRSPAGRQLVVAQVAASFPAAGKAGEPIRAETARMVLTIPHAAVSALIRRHVRTVAGIARLTTGIAQGGKVTTSAWPGLATPATPLPPSESLTLSASGPVPPIVATAPGNLTVAAAGLLVVIQPHAAAGDGISSLPDARTSPNIHLACTLNPGQNAVLATVSVGGTKARASPRPAHKSQCPKLSAALKLNPRFPPPKPPPGSTVGSAPEHGCAYTGGYADVRKLKGAALISPGLTNVNLFVRTVINENPKVNYAEFDNAAELDFNGLREFPPSTATFLTFGFVPTTATIQLQEHGTINIFAIGPALVARCPPPKSCATVATVYSRLSVRVTPGSVKVNGVPLDVGSQCQTPQFDAILTGTSASKPPYSVVTGGPLTGMVDIPPFKHCGVGENLNPIFTSAISGSRNFNLLTQGAVCFVLGGGTCPPPKPKLVREVSG